MTLPIKGKSLGNPDDAAAIAIARGGNHPEQIRRYARGLWWRCGTFSTPIRADVLWGQADLETGNRQTGIGFQSARWDEGNPAGIAITNDKPDAEAGPMFSPETWADIHAAHAAGYAGIDPGPELRALDIRWQAMIDAGYFGVAETVQDLDERWAWDGPENYGDKIEARWRLYDFPAMAGYTQPPAGDGTGGTDGRPDVALTFGRVPHPGYIDIRSEMAGKPEGVGWDNLGKRNPKFIVLHRMWGTLAGTRSYFASPTVGALTDYGIGVADPDGAASAGVIHLYNDPRGYRSGWASGRVSAPYGDGLKVVNKYGVNAVNRDGVSFEISGYNGPIDDVAWQEIVKLAAYWCDQMEIPYSSLPLNPHTGINAFIWHQEFTIGTGKECPFSTVMGLTNKLYRDTAAYMQPYQEVGVIEPAPEPEPEPEPEPIPAPQYAPPAPIEALALLPDADRDGIAAITTAEATDFIYVGDRVEAVRDTPRLQRANAGARRTGPDIKAGEQFDVDYIFTARNGKRYYLTGWWTRVKVEDTKRISD